MKNLSEIHTPTLLLDEQKCRANIRQMAEKAARNGVIFRPHFKTHQSLEVGRWFREYGVDKITVSSLLMAEYFSQDGWDDITVAFPVNLRETDRINRLAEKVKLNLLVESLEAVEALGNSLKHSHETYIKVDIGYHRTGLQPDDVRAIGVLLDGIEKTAQLGFKGFLGHAGHSYAVRGKAEIEAIHHSSIELMRGLKDRYGNLFPEMIVSTGDTPTCSVMEDLSGTDEIRPGNFVFYDLMQSQIGSCRMEEIAVALACPVVAKHPLRQEIVIYGGGIHLSKDRMLLDDGNVCFGLVVELNNKGWGRPVSNTYVKAISQEHGVIRTDSDYLKKVRIGDVLGILPVHSCMTADLMGSYLELKGERIEAMNQGAFK